MSRSCIAEINLKVEDILAAQMTVEQLKERDQLLSAQNEMLKVSIINRFNLQPCSCYWIALLPSTEFCSHLLSHLFLQVDKSNLLRRVADLDEMVKTLLGTQITQQRAPPTSSARACS